MATVFAIVLALITLVLFPILIRIVATLLEIAMFLVITYALTNYTVLAWQLFSSSWWIIYAGFAVVGAAIWMGLYLGMIYLQHTLRHPSWGEVGCRACNENDTVNGYLGDQLRRKVATLSPLTKTVNEILTSIRSLPLLVLVWGGSAGLIGYGWLNGQPLWALAAGVLYGIIVNWQLADRDYQMQKAVLVLLGMTRHEALQQAQALEAAAVESEPDDADEDNDEDEDEADDKPWKYPSA